MQFSSASIEQILGECSAAIVISEAGVEHSVFFSKVIVLVFKANQFQYCIFISKSLLKLKVNWYYLKYIGMSRKSHGTYMKYCRWSSGGGVCSARLVYLWTQQHCCPGPRPTPHDHTQRDGWPYSTVFPGRRVTWPAGRLPGRASGAQTASPSQRRT